MHLYFPGQGAQYVGMGYELYKSHAIVRNIYDKASDILKLDVANLSFLSDESELEKTENTQIAILTMSLAILELLKEHGIETNILAGLSLGEYTALIYSNILGWEEGLQLVQKRGVLMQQYVPKGDWAMAAIIGLKDEKVEEICKMTSFAIPTNYNCPGQVVVSGDRTSMEFVMQKAKEEGAKKVMLLKTSGPFHTTALLQASKQFEKELVKVSTQFWDEKTIFKNIDAMPYRKTDNIKAILAKHITSPVYFGKSITRMIDMGVDTFIEVGPSKVLSGFIHRINREVTVMHIEDNETLKSAVQLLKK